MALSSGQSSMESQDIVLSSSATVLASFTLTAVLLTATTPCWGTFPLAADAEVAVVAPETQELRAVPAVIAPIKIFATRPTSRVDRVTNRI